MSKPVALVTGAGGEMGHRLVPELREQGYDVVAVDLIQPARETRDACVETVESSILELETMAAVLRRWRPTAVYHLAAVLSSKAERDPDLAHQVNVEGTLQLFRLCRTEAGGPGDRVTFLFPSSIAVYGLPDPETKAREGALREWQWTQPAGVYGCNKLYCELMGTRLSRMLHDGGGATLDFRSIRFPGLISADTLPTSGTTDYAPAMIHAAAQGEPYDCFVEADTRLPFMTMPDAVEALLTLARADAARLSRRVYNIRGFDASAEEIRGQVVQCFPDARIDYAPVPARQALADSWPADIDDRLARRDWGLAPRHGLVEAVRDYLVPALRSRYAQPEQA